jgi:hypothetical protein
MRATIRKAVEKVPIVRDLVRERERLKTELAAARQSATFVPPGHYYSPIPSLDEVRRDEALIFDEVPRVIPGVDLREREQLDLLERFKDYYREQPFGPHKVPGRRYYFENDAYAYSDAIVLYCMMRHLAPRRYVEIGSGFSSCVALDTNDLFFGGAIATTFIEPYPERLLSLVAAEDHARMTVIPRRLQDVALETFDVLEANDILFVDSTHVSKVHSDVNRIFFEILPRLKPGVHVHFHDVFYPFEYPKAWVYEGRAWNEAYLLRAFLQYNPAFPMVFMNTFMERYHEGVFRADLPLCLRNPGGSIWIRKAAG